MTEHPNLSAALVAALADCSVVDKGRTANAGTYKYDYADLGDVVKKTRPTLAEHGVIALTPVVDNGDDLQVTVVLLHASGERLDFGPFSFPHGKDAQATGSMVTYHRRYALVSALGMAAGDDDDGATAQPRQPKAKAEPTPEHVRRLTGAMNSIEDEVTRVAVKKAFLDQWGKPQDVSHADADDAEMFIVDMLAELAKDAAAARMAAAYVAELEVAPTGHVTGERESEIPGSDTPAPSGATKPATNSPAAAARAALNGEKPPKPALGAKKQAPTEELLADAFPGSEVVTS